MYFQYFNSYRLLGDVKYVVLLYEMLNEGAQ